MKLMFAGLAGVMLLLLGSGCQSFTKLPSGNLAEVTINNQPDTAIMQATTNVFVSHGFSVANLAADQCTFRRPGTRADNIAYGNSLFDEKVTLQVVVQIDRIDAQSAVLGCKAALVQEANDPFFSDSHPVGRFSRSPYEELLKDVQMQLGQ